MHCPEIRAMGEPLQPRMSSSLIVPHVKKCLCLLWCYHTSGAEIWFICTTWRFSCQSKTLWPCCRQPSGVLGGSQAHAALLTSLATSASGTQLTSMSIPYTCLSTGETLFEARSCALCLSMGGVRMSTCMHVHVYSSASAHFWFQVHVLSISKLARLSCKTRACLKKRLDQTHSSGLS